MNVSIENISKSYEKPVVQGISLQINHGEFVTLLGPSGCGKTTLLRMIAGLEIPDHGKIAVGKETFFSSDSKINVSPHKRNMGFVFQSYALWPHMTVEENVGFSLKVRGVKSEERKAKVAEALKLIAMEDLSHRYPSELSGGQQQRVALARAIAQEPQVMLLDEPLSNLDAKLRDQMRKELKKLHEKLGLTMIYVTHDKTEALELSTRMAIIDHGRLVQFDTPAQVLKNPATEFVEFLVR